jgi:hypothetical protein
MVGKMWGKRNPYTLLVGMQTSITTLENNKKLNIDLSYDPAIPLLGIHSKDLRLRLLHRHLHTHVYCSTIHNGPVMETAKMPHY